MMKRQRTKGDTIVYKIMYRRKIAEPQYEEHYNENHNRSMQLIMHIITDRFSTCRHSLNIDIYMNGKLQWEN